jgi:multidrug transporter EmrE-like cation transporter
MFCTFAAAVPAVADLVATALMNMGLVHITASVYQMLRGAELVFAAIFSIVFLKRKLNYMHLNGLLLRCACACADTATSHLCGLQCPAVRSSGRVGA